MSKTTEDRQTLIAAVKAAATPAASPIAAAPVAATAPGYSPTTEQSILISQARASGALAERKRIETILTCKEAEGRETLATHFAFKTDFDPKAAQIALAASPVAMTKEDLDYQAGAAAARALLGK